MSGELGFIDLNAEELGNTYRSRSYILNGLAASAPWNLTDRGCEVLSREIGGVAPFVSPALDPAPWYDASIAESGEFLGLYVTTLDFKTIDVKRSISQRFGGIGGGVLGFEQVAARGVYVKAWLLASTCPGLEYGRAWVYSKLGADCNGCTLGTIRLRDSCPPSNGSNDTRGEWIIYDAALVDGIKRSDNPGWPCCYYDPIEFTLAGESPYLYKRPGAATAAVEVQSDGGIIPPLPAVLDTFVRANTGPPPSASWTGPAFQGELNTLVVASNLLDRTHSANTEASAYWNAATFGPDVTVTQVVPTRVNSGEFDLMARIVTPNTATNNGATLRISFGAGAGLDGLTIGRFKGAFGTTGEFVQRTGLTFASGDTFALVCRGNLLEAWRKPSGSGWVRIAAVYDPTPAVVGNVGVGIREFNGVTTQTLGSFGAGTLTNPVYPVDPIIIPVPATSIGITSPIVTLTTIEGQPSGSGNVAARVRVQLKQYANCTETDDFAVNDLATKWYQASNYYTITGGKLKPVATTGTKTINRSYDGTTGNRVFYPGGRVEAQLTLGATITNGAWGAFFASSNAWYGIGAFLVRTSTHGSNLFCLSYDAALTAMPDSVSFTPVASTTYRIILEVLPFNDGTGSFDVRGYLVDQAAPTIMLTRPLRATFTNSLAGSPIGPLFSPSIQSIPADTAEAWDTFYAIDYSASPALMDVAMPPGTMILDGSRRVTQLTPAFLSSLGAFSTGSAVDGSAYISSPAETPLGWPDVCAGTGPGCLQIFGGEMPYTGTTVSVALQTRAR